MLKKTPTKEDIIVLFEAVSSLAAENCQKLLPQVENYEDEKDYYFGILQRMYVFLADMATILTHSKHSSVSSTLIIGRCIYDDFIKLKFVDESENRSETVVKLNADAHKHTLKRLQELEELNSKFFKGQFEFYPTKENLAEYKQRFLANKGNLKYLVNGAAATVDNLKFQPFPSVRDVVLQLQEKAVTDDVGRAYYFWGEWSAFIHFSGTAYKMEDHFFEDVENERLFWRRLQELGVAACISIKTILRYFHQQHKYDPIDKAKVVYGIFNTPMAD